MLREKEFKKGEVVLREGETGNSMYIVLSGTLYATRKCEDGSDVRMLLFRPGDFVGVTTLIEMEPRPFTITAEKEHQAARAGTARTSTTLQAGSEGLRAGPARTSIASSCRRLRKAGARIAHLTRLAGLDHAPEHH